MREGGAGGVGAFAARGAVGEGEESEANGHAGSLPKLFFKLQ
jgi:hypothetical protein